MTDPLFKTAAELGTAEAIHTYLVSVLELFESGQVEYDRNHHVKPQGFNLSAVIEHHENGVCACIFGWALIVAGIPDAGVYSKNALGGLFRFVGMINTDLADLFWGPVDRTWDLNDVTLEQATAAIRNYLTRGKPYWREIMT